MRGKSVTLWLFVFGLSLAAANEDSGEDSDEGWTYLPVQKTNTTEPPRTTPQGTTTTSTTTTTTEDEFFKFFGEDSGEDSDEEGWEILPVQKATSTTERPQTTTNVVPSTSTSYDIDESVTEDPTEVSGEAGCRKGLPVTEATTTTEKTTTTDAAPEESTTTTPATALKLSCPQIRQFVDVHNARRLMVANGTVPRQPPAHTMNLMIWDEELAAKASHWASQNPSGHNPDKTVGSGKYETGENMYMSWSNYESGTFDGHIAKALKGWFDEHKDYTYGPIKASEFDAGKKKIGHYTQMVWSESTHVGCGVAKNRKGIWTKIIVVCNYGPSGNYEGQKPYGRGSGAGALACGAGDCSKQYGDKC